MSYSTKDFARLCDVCPTHLIYIGAWEGVDVPEFLELKIPNITLIEALPEKAKVLRSKYAMHENVKILEFAASDKSGDLVDFYPLNYGSSSLLKPNLNSLRKFYADFTEMESIRVRTLKIDDITTGPEDKIIFIIDVQGAELQVLKGAVNTLKNVIAIKIEVSTVAYYEGHSHQSQIEGFLRAHKFVKISQRFSKSMGQGDAIFVRKENFRVSKYFVGKMFDLRWKISVREHKIELVRRTKKIMKSFGQEA